MYPLSETRKTASKYEYKIALIADLDTDSKEAIDKANHKYVSYLLRGTLTIYVVLVRKDIKNKILKNKCFERTIFGMPCAVDSLHQSLNEFINKILRFL